MVALNLESENVEEEKEKGIDSLSSCQAGGWELPTFNKYNYFSLFSIPSTMS